VQKDGAALLLLLFVLVLFGLLQALAYLSRRLPTWTRPDAPSAEQRTT
jgi:hypothetical protein